MTRYLLILSESEGIYCVGDRPHVGDILRVKKPYSDTTLLMRVTCVTLTQNVYDLPYNDKGDRGNECDDVPEVRVERM